MAATLTQRSILTLAGYDNGALPTQQPEALLVSSPPTSGCTGPGTVFAFTPSCLGLVVERALWETVLARGARLLVSMGPLTSKATT